MNKKQKVLIVGGDSVASKVIKETLSKHPNVDIVDKIDTSKGIIKAEELEIVEPNRGDTPLPAIQGDPVNRFMREMREGDLPAEAEGRTLYIFHRETGQRMEHSLELIMKNRKFAFQVWAKTYEFALSEFVRRTKWKKRMGKNTPCPLPEIKD